MKMLFDLIIMKWACDWGKQDGSSLGRAQPGSVSEWAGCLSYFMISFALLIQALI